MNDEDYWAGGDLNWPNCKFLSRSIYTDASQEFGKQFSEWFTSHNMFHVVFGPTTGKKTRLGTVERFNRTLRELYFEHQRCVCVCVCFFLEDPK